MWRSGSLTNNVPLNKYVDFKPTDSKETKQRDPFGPKIEVDVVVMCINCMPEHAQKDIEELRMFEYSLSYYNQIYYLTRQKISARAESSIAQPQNLIPNSGALMAPAVITNSYLLPPSGALNPNPQPSSLSNTQWGLTNTIGSINTSNPNLNLNNSINNPFNTNLNNSINNPFNNSLTNPINNTLNTNPFNNTLNNNLNNLNNNNNFNNLLSNAQSQSNQLGFNNLNNNLNKPLNNFNILTNNSLNNNNLNTAQNQAGGLSSVWSNPINSAPPQPQPPAAQVQPQIVYPANYAAYSQPPFIPPTAPTATAAYYPPLLPPPRYRLPVDPYQYAYDGFGRDPYAYLYRDPYAEFPPQNSYANKIAMQRAAAQTMWFKYGLDPNLPLSENFLESKNFRRRGEKNEREINTDYHGLSRGFPKDPVIHVVPTLAGIKGGKQQIVLDIEETPENRHYIPKIFNPNSEISFTISSKESPANKSYLANLISDNPEEIIPDNLNQSQKINQKDLPRPILNKKNISKKKSILDMDLSDYQLSPKIEPVPGSSERRRVTFQDESLKKASINESQFFSPLLSTHNTRQDSLISEINQHNHLNPSLNPILTPNTIKFNQLNNPLVNQENNPRIKISGIPETDQDDKGISMVNGISSSDEISTGIKFPVSHELDSKNNISLHSNDHSYISKFKWTPSWFISKLVSSFSHDPQEPNSVTNVSNASIVSGSGVILTREGYYTNPPIEELDSLVTDNHCFVRGFTVGRYNVGKVMFEGTTDVFGLNLDKIVFINDHEIEVYRDEDSTVVKPPVGSGLNKPAKLTLFNIFPRDKDGKFMKTFDTDTLKDFETYLQRKSNELNAEFIEYIPQSGSFTFSVQHFTKYGIFEDTEASISVSFVKISSVGNSVCNPVPNTNSFPNKNDSDSKDTNVATNFSFNFNGKRNYQRRFRDLISRPELITNDLGSKWISSYKLSKRSNQNINILELEGSASKQDINFISLTNIKNFLSSLINSISLTKSYVPFCRFNDPNLIFNIYSKNSNVYIFDMIHSLWCKDTTYTFNQLDSLFISRKKHFLNWLKINFEKQANIECKFHLKNNNIFSAVLSLISANLMQQAVELLNSTNNPRLACMLSNFDNCNKIIFSQQLDRWLSTALYEQMDVSYIKIITLLSGHFVIDFDDHFIHVCEGFDWLRCFGLFLNFCDFKEDPLLTAFDLYSQHYKEYSSQVSSPVFKDDSLHIGFHILRYFSTGEIDMPKMFETDSYTYDALDYSLSWNVYMILKMIKPINFINESILTINFAKQLENLGYWSYSVFILQFLKCDRTRISYIRDVILAHLDSLDDNISIFKSLNISIELLDECRAYYLRYIGDEIGCLDSLISGGEFDKAFSISIKNKIPNLFLSNSFRELFEHLSLFEASYFSSNTYFLNNGKIYLDYISVLSKTHSGDFERSEICDLFDNILSILPMMDSSTRYQQLARRTIAIECLKQLGKSHIKKIDFGDLLSKSIFEPEFLISFVQNNINNLI